MTPEQAAAYITARAAVLNCRVAGMEAENQHRLSFDGSVAYDGADFFALEREFEAELGVQAVRQMFRFANENHA